MTEEAARQFWTFAIPICLLFVMGFYCVLVTYNLIRVLIGLELLTKGVTLLIIVAGHLSGRVALAQTLVITLIVIEVVVVVIGGGLVVQAFQRHGSLNAKNLRSLKG
jgi:NADH:ubiquinone oxidoreductase subunit K